jgi:MFS family permease
MDNTDTNLYPNADRRAPRRASPSPGSDAGARLATRLAFWVAGFGVAAWAPLVPFAKQRLQVDDGTLGLLLLCLGVGSVAAMVRTGPLCARHGCKPVIVAGGALMVLLLPVLAVVHSPWLAGLALLVFGGALGSLDVAMNVHAVEVERQAGRPLMSGFHALFSAGGFVGAACVTFMLSRSVAPLVATLLGAASMAVALGLAAPRLLHTADGSASTAAPAPGAAAGAALPSGALKAWPRGPVVLLALLAAVTFLVEGALLDWSALLLTTIGLSTAERAGIGFALFSVAMTVGRFSGDRITALLGDRAVVWWGGWVVLAGFALLQLGGRLELALAGFVLIGLGASNMVPVLFRQAGAQRAMPAALAVSAVTTTGYAGYLMGPAMVGFVSSTAGLPQAFWVLAGLMALVPVFARRATARQPGQDET